MGSSKKSKKEHKEHKHKKRDRSPSPSDRQRSRSREKESKHKEKKRKKEFSEENSDKQSNNVRIKDEPKEKSPISHGKDNDVSSSKSHLSEVNNGASASGDVSLSIEETNRLRAKLGLKPLETNASKQSGDDKASTSKKDDVHIPAVNLGLKHRTDSLKEKLELQKEKRKISSSLSKVKTLGEDDDDDGALAWVMKSRKLEEDKILAEKRAKMLEELDSDFGISSLVEEEFGNKKGAEYSAKNLKGLKVEHALESFSEGKTVILTLKDKGILEEDDDTLVNVNIIDSEKAKEYIENKKKKPDYKPYDEPEYDEYGMFKPKEILEKYNEEIEGKKVQSFVLGSGGRYDAEEEREMARIRSTLQQQGQNLVLPEPVLATDFYSQSEMAKFKKPVKKVRKIRKAVKADDLLPLADENLSQPSSLLRRRRLDDDDSGDTSMDTTPAIPGLDLVKKEKEDTNEIPGLDLVQLDALLEKSFTTDIDGPEEDMSGIIIDDEPSIELETALEKARRLKQVRERLDVEQLVSKNVKLEPDDDDDNDFGWKSIDEQEKPTIMLNTTSEFCRSLGESLFYGRANTNLETEEEDELLDFERDLVEQRKANEEQAGSGWQKVENGEQKPAELTTEQEPTTGLEEEPVLNSGLAAALGLAAKKGYLEKDKPKTIAGTRLTMLPDGDYTIEDKKFEDIEDKYTRKRDRMSYGAVTDFKEKEGYKPEVKITYVDDKGRQMDAKEAFRYLSHRFHGKGSGKKKTEKRIQKYQEELMMRSMSSSDTPLGTASLLEDKLKKEKLPYLVLSGASKSGGSGTSLTK